MNPKVSIIIPVYNGSDYMREAIDSALDQTYNNIEVIVINDGSNDDDKTRNVALSYGDRIRYFEKENGGTSTALNFGIIQMKGDYFAWLSHDDMYMPDRIQKHMDSILFSGSPYTPVHSKRLLWINGIDCVRFNNGIKKKLYYEAGATAAMLGLIDGLSITFHRDYFDKYGLFDEQLRTTQDYQKWFEMFHDKKMIFLEDCLAKNRIHERQQGNRISDVWMRESNQLYTYMSLNVSEKDALLADTDLYVLLGAALTRFEGIGCIDSAETAKSRMMSMLEPEGAEEKRQSLRNKYNGDIYLYGMGKRGQALNYAFYLRGVKVTAFSDRNSEVVKKTFYGVSGVSPDNLPKDGRIIVTMDRPDNVVRDFIGNGYGRIITYNDIIEEVLEVPAQKELLV